MTTDGAERRCRMRLTARQGLGWALGSLLLFVILTRPLLLHWTTAIPSSAQNHEIPPVRESIPGDHMQLLYHFDLVADMFSGRIPWLHNLWEFNTGDDSERFRLNGSFAPGSAVYALLRQVTSQAGAWNTTLWLSTWISAWTLWIWLGRFTRDPWSRAFGLVIMMGFPYRWASLLGGSPAGIALMWMGMLVLAIDSCLRRPGFGIGFLTGLLYLFVFWGDLHVFYLTSLAIPGFALMTLLDLPAPPLRKGKAYLKLLPGLLTGFAAIAGFYLWRTHFLADTLMGGGRTWHELMLYSADRRAVWTLGRGIEETVFLGPPALIGLLAALAHAAARLLHNRRRAEALRTLSVALLFLALLLTIAVSLGSGGPRSGRAIRWARAAVPYFTMIRQPTKLFCVVGLYAGWLLAAGWRPLDHEPRLWGRLRRSTLLLFTLAAAWTYFRAISATIAVLPGDQPAYEAVVADARARGFEHPRALVVPLWPGDSDQTSILLFFAHRHGLRLVNGYTPAVTRRYFEEVFRRLESVNMGHLTDAQIDFMLEMGVSHLLIHEDMFPERVSPFPVQETVRHLEGHPRVALLTRAGPVRALRLLTEPDPDSRPAPRVSPAAFSARRWDLQRMPREGGVLIEDSEAGGGSFWRGNEGSHLLISPARLPPRPELVWWLRARGNGQVEIETATDGTLQAVQQVDLDDIDWRWHVIPLRMGEAFGQVRLTLRIARGSVDLDTLLLTAGDWTLPPEGLQLPAAEFFRAGHPGAVPTDIHFQRHRDRAGLLLYGPRLPLPAGQPLRLELRFSADAPPGTDLGRFQVRLPGTGLTEEVPVRQGQPAVLFWTPPTDLPAELGFHFSRAADLTVHQVDIEPMPTPPQP